MLACLLEHVRMRHHILDSCGYTAVSFYSFSLDSRLRPVGKNVAIMAHLTGGTAVEKGRKTSMITIELLSVNCSCPCTVRVPLHIGRQFLVPSESVSNVRYQI
jgi:hypothetical protein